ncbi:hypothetical protein EML15_00040 [Corynebacterium sp. sy017]|uniref:hypothetical protein n=1 Tax=unclassified Corynebacterium TaxID=2624378 RepID=UPI001186B6C4|nr:MULTISPECIES: hypothetical protein [unclassified Corynebacterium]MBP3087544.1 hypothetical protein [Corynebacterium sp. sy017]TSD92122.1 hypothetical protein ELY17_00040 [Corynebacterium sp. SY003]
MSKSDWLLTIAALSSLLLGLGFIIIFYSTSLLDFSTMLANAISFIALAIGLCCALGWRRRQTKAKS